MNEEDPSDAEDTGPSSRAQIAWEVARQTVSEWLEDDAIRWGAAIAYYTVVSLAPLVVLGATLLGQVVDDERAEGWIIAQVDALMGPQAVEVVTTVLEQTGRLDLASLGAFLTAALLLVGATAVFANLQRALNRIWGVEARGGVLKELVRTRVAAFVTVLALGGVVLASTIAGAALGWLRPLLSFVDSFFPLIRAVDVGSSIFLLWLSVGAVFWVLPDVEISWRDVWFGALVTAVLLVVGKAALASFLARKATASMYGSAGAIFLLLLWVYYSAQVFFLGAEFTQVWAKRRGRAIRPKPYAVPIAGREEEGVGA